VIGCAVKHMGVLFFDFVREHSFPFAVVDFEKMVRLGDWHVEQGGGVGAALKRGGPDLFNVVVGFYIFGG